MNTASMLETYARSRTAMGALNPSAPSPLPAVPLPGVRLAGTPTNTDPVALPFQLPGAPLPLNVRRITPPTGAGAQPSNAPTHYSVLAMGRQRNGRGYHDHRCGLLFSRRLAIQDPFRRTAVLGLTELNVYLRSGDGRAQFGHFTDAEATDTESGGGDGPAIVYRFMGVQPQPTHPHDTSQHAFPLLVVPERRALVLNVWNASKTAVQVGSQLYLIWMKFQDRGVRRAVSDEPYWQLVPFHSTDRTPPPLGCTTGFTTNRDGSHSAWYGASIYIGQVTNLYGATQPTDQLRDLAHAASIPTDMHTADAARERLPEIEIMVRRGN